MPSKRVISILAVQIRQTQEELMDFMKQQHPEEIFVIEGVRGFFRGKSDVAVFNYIKTALFPHSVHIKASNLVFFKDNKQTIFEGLPQAYIDSYTDLVMNSPPEDLQTIWKFFQTLVGIYELSLKNKKQK